MSRELVELTRQFNALKQAFDNRVLPEVPGPWRDWTPAISQNGAVAVAIAFARYIVLTKVVILTMHLSITGTGSAGSAIIISGVPLAPAYTNLTTGSGYVVDAGTGIYSGYVNPVGVDDFRIVQAGQPNFVGITPNFALANTDEISFTVVYETP